jgi:hypothetical protein
VRDPQAFNAFAAAVRRDTESVLAKYDIADKSSERQLLGTLLQIDLLDGRDADALKRIEQIRALQEAGRQAADRPAGARDHRWPQAAGSTRPLLIWPRPAQASRLR